MLEMFMHTPQMAFIAGIIVGVIAVWILQLIWYMIYGLFHKIFGGDASSSFSNSCDCGTTSYDECSCDTKPVLNYANPSHPIPSLPFATADKQHLVGDALASQQSHSNIGQFRRAIAGPPKPTVAQLEIAAEI